MIHKQTTALEKSRNLFKDEITRHQGQIADLQARIKGLHDALNLLDVVEKVEETNAARRKAVRLKNKPVA